MTDAIDLRVSLHGPNVTRDDALRAGEATADLLHAIAQTLGAPQDAVGWRIQSVQFQCDGCHLTRPDRPGPGENWTHRDGDDFCPTCSAVSDPSLEMQHKRADG